MTPRSKNGPPITPAEIERRYAALRAAMERDHLDALLVCGNQYAGFEGAVRYVSGFEIVHRYAYVLLPLAGDPTLVFPAEARWIGDKKKPWVREQVWPEIPGRWLRDRARQHGWKRLGVVGLDFVMAVRDYRELAESACEIVAWDFPFDMVRAVKSDWELAHIGQSMEAILDGFDALVRNFEPGKTEAEIMAPAVERFFAGGAGPRMMNIVLSGPHGEAEAHFKVPGDRVVEPGDLMLYSLEIGGYEGYWVEFSRALIRGKPSARIQQMSAAYPEAMEAVRRLMREGERAGEAEVFAFDVSHEHVCAIRQRGLRISGEADFTARLQASTDAAEIPRCDYGIVATKSTHTRPATAATACIFDDQSAVCSVQNGVGNEEIVAEHVRFVIRGTTFPAGHVIEPGHVGFDIRGDTWIGPFEPTSTPMQKVEELAGLITRAGMNTVAMADARGAQWTKLIFNAGTNPVGALTQLHHGAAAFFPPTGELFDALIDEGIAVANALGIKLDGDPKALVKKAAHAPGKHKASMLQDILAKRPTEVDFMNGAIVRWGEKTGVPTPLNRAVWQLIKGLEHSWTIP